MTYQLRNIVGRHLGRAVEKLPTERKALMKTYLHELIEKTDVQGLRTELAATLYEGAADSSLYPNAGASQRALKQIKYKVGPGSWEYTWKPMLQELLDED